MSEITSNGQQKLWILANCIETNEEVVGKTSDELIATTDKEGIWWFCPACKGWHVSIAKNMVREKSGDGSEIISRSNLTHQRQQLTNTSGSKTDYQHENPFIEFLSPFNSYSSIYWAY